MKKQSLSTPPHTAKSSQSSPQQEGKHAALFKALQWYQQGHKVALATVVHTWGSAPRPVGSMLAIREDGLFAGSVSGGCVEGDVISSAQEVFASCKPVTKNYGVSNSKAWEVGLTCGGRLSIYIEPVTKAPSSK